MIQQLAHITALLQALLSMELTFTHMQHVTLPRDQASLASTIPRNGNSLLSP